MGPVTDTAISLCVAAAMATLSVTALARVDPGEPLQGWRDGSYQRGFETRFEAALPTQTDAVALWASLRWHLLGEAAQGAVVGAEGWMFTAEEFTVPAIPRDLRAELPRVRDALAERGIALVPVIVPDKARIHAHRLPRGRSAGFAARYDHALAAIAEAGLPALDLRPALGFDASYLRTDTHWTAKGARSAADAIAAGLKDMPLAASTVETRATGAQAFKGDLLAFVATGAFQPQVGPAPEQIATFETHVTSAGGLFGDAAIPVALVGTSFSAKPAFHFDGFLKQALGADLFNASVIGQGPFAPMDSFLSELDGLASLPTLVIWEIPERYLTPRSPKS